MIKNILMSLLVMFLLLDHAANANELSLDQTDELNETTESNVSTEPTEKKATLYIYRVPSSSENVPTVKLNGENVFQLPTGSYSYVYLEPGDYKLSLEYADPGMQPLEANINVQEGQEIFEEYVGSPGASLLSEIPKDEALKNIESFIYIEPTKKDFNALDEDA